MSSGADRLKAIVSTWIGCTAAGAAAVVAEVRLLDDVRALAVGATIAVAMLTGILATRKLLTRSRRPLITVMDLRRR